MNLLVKVTHIFRLILPEGDDDGSRIAFEWKTESKKYRRSPSKDKAESD
nr:hypothetical protein [Escherichia coli]